MLKAKKKIVTPLSVSQEKVYFLIRERLDYWGPKKSAKRDERYERGEYCYYHKVNRHEVDDCRSL